MERTYDLCFPNGTYLYFLVSIPWMPWEPEFWSAKKRHEWRNEQLTKRKPKSTS